LLLGCVGAGAWFAFGRTPATPKKDVAAVPVSPSPLVSPDPVNNSNRVPPPTTNVNPTTTPTNPRTPIASPPPAVGELPPDLVEKTRRATAFIEVSAGTQGATGSGFLVRSNGDTGYIVTNYHVIDVDEEPPATAQQTQPTRPGG